MQHHLKPHKNDPKPKIQVQPLNPLPRVSWFLFVHKTQLNANEPKSGQLCSFRNRTNLPLPELHPRIPPPNLGPRPRSFSSFFTGRGVDGPERSSQGEGRNWAAEQTAGENACSRRKKEVWIRTDVTRSSIERDREKKEKIRSQPTDLEKKFSPFTFHFSLSKWEMIWEMVFEMIPLLPEPQPFRHPSSVYRVFMKILQEIIMHN